MIVAENIKKSYNGIPVLHGIDLKINKGEFVSIMGESGSGKSTLLGILGGNLKPDSGNVLIDGESITDANDKALSRLRRTKLGFVYSRSPQLSLSVSREQCWEDTPCYR